MAKKQQKIQNVVYSTNPNFVVYYYDSLATANADINAGSFGNAIGNPNAYTNSSSPQLP